MRDHSKGKSGLILDLTLSPGLGSTRLVVTMEEGRATLEVSRQGSPMATFEAPDGLSAFDLPIWCLSVVGATFPDLGQEALWATEPDLRRRIPSIGGTFTVCIGPKTELHRCQLVHFERDNVDYVHQGSNVVITARDPGQRFLDAAWTTIIHARSVLRAEELVRQIEHSCEALFSRDENILSIVAHNAERWVAAGMTAEQVLKLASNRGILLRQYDAEGPALSFRVVIADG